ncbi:MAG: tyrosine-type recombinase/integrase, partial [bacterium]
VRQVATHARDVMRVIDLDPTRGISISIDDYVRPVFTIQELRRLVSDRARWNLSEKGRKIRAAIADCGGDKQEAAQRLGVHFTTIYNWLKRPMREDPWWLFCVIGVYGGLRSGEIAAMQWEWVDWRNDLIIVPPDASKNGHYRYVPVMPELRAALMERFKVGMTGTVVEGLPEQSSRPHGFERYLKRIGVTRDGRSAHSLRATCAALLIAMGMDSMAVQHHLGHEDKKMTRHYSQLANLFRKEVVAEGWRDQFHLRSAPVREEPIVLADAV